MDVMLAFLLMFYWRSFATRGAVVLRKRRRLFEAQRPIEVARPQLRQQRRRIRDYSYCQCFHCNIHFTLSLKQTLMCYFNNNRTVLCRLSCINWASSVR